MTGQLMLVIVVVGATAAAAIAYRWVKASRHHNAGAIEGALDAPPAVAPTTALGPPTTAGETPTTAQDTPTESAAAPVPNEPAPSEPGAGARTEPEFDTDANPATADEPALEFTLEIADPQGTSTTDTATPTAAPTTTQAATPTARPTTTQAAAPTAAPTPPALQPAEIFAKLFDLALGKPRPASMISAAHEEVVTATATALQDAATQERYAPRRPNMLPRVLSASNDDSFSSRDLAALIARDPSLVGNLLKIANSSYYRVTPEPVESVDRAVVLLGTDGIRSLVTAALMQPIFRIGGADFPRFPEIAWEHTFRSANAAVPYNFLLEKSDPYAAELLSLVMGLAEIVVFRVTMDQYAKLPRLRPDAGIVSSILDAHSATIARRIGTSWELSEATLTGLDGQSVNTSQYPTALGRSLYFGRVVGALAVLKINHVIDDNLGTASIPQTSMPAVQIERMWTKLTSKPDKH